MVNLNRRRLVKSNYILRKPVTGILLEQPGVVDEMPWTLYPGALVQVYETDHFYIVERTGNLLPGLLKNVSFKGIVDK